MTKMSTQELFSNLKCIRCGTKETEISPYKKRGLIPTCINCRRKFKIKAFSNLPFYLLITTFSIITVYILINVLLVLSMSRDYLALLGLPWFIVLLVTSIGMFISIIIIILLRRLFSSKLKKYFIDDDGPFIKSEIDTEWLSYRDWINQTLLERETPENTISDLIEAEIKRQITMKEKNTKIGRILIGSGMFFILLGLISLIYGYYASIVLTGYAAHGAYIFTVVHLPPASILLLFGFIELVYGKQKKKFYNLN